MDKIEIVGGKTLNGVILISGSKNASLPILASSLLTDKEIKLKNVPKLSDIDSMIKLLESLNTKFSFNDGNLTLKNNTPKKKFASYDLVRKMRASFLVMGPLLARYGYAEVSLPGGCAIGARPIDLHLAGFKKMGAKFKIKDGYVKVSALNGLKGAEINLPIVSVGATENLLMAATLAKGKTKIVNASKEPEVVDLGNCLKAMGAKIDGLGTRNILVTGLKKLSGCSYTVMPDRVEVGTYILALLGCSGHLILKKINKEIGINTLKIFSKMNNLTLKLLNDNSMSVEVGKKKNQSINIKTESYPGFPTDLQAQLTAVMSKSEGISIIEETIFENRFMHIAELKRMGAKIKIKGSKVFIDGQDEIFGAPVMATDLRASSSLIIAGLMARGKTIISRVYHLDRGYESLEKKLSDCNADIKRIRE